MNFKDNKAIYLQIADLLCDEILGGEYAEEERTPSVREYAAKVEVNANTCARAYDWLQGHEIIYTKRGLGYFVCLGAKEAIHEMRKKEFFSETLPEMFHKMDLLNISINDLINEFNRTKSGGS